jgi:DNA-directed RNA polymerase
MLRDEVGGSAVNLVPADRPQDIYAQVATVCNRKLQEATGTELDPDGHAGKALTFGITRKITKSPVMTIVYGSTLRNCLRKTTEYIIEHPELSVWSKEDMYSGAVYTGKMIWGSIDEVVIAARAGMQWLRKVSSIVSKLNKPIIFYTPTGWKVFQSIMRVKAKVIKTQLLGTVLLKIVEDTDDVSPGKQANGIAPNFVHSLDASHLCLTVNASNFSSYAMIHDSFGTHACNTTELASILRTTFVKMYSEHDVLQEFKDSLEELYGIELPDLPMQGTLDIQGVENSEYFFG